MTPDEQLRIAVQAASDHDRTQRVRRQEPYCTLPPRDWKAPDMGHILAALRELGLLPKSEGHATDLDLVEKRLHGRVDKLQVRICKIEARDLLSEPPAEPPPFVPYPGPTVEDVLSGVSAITARDRAIDIITDAVKPVCSDPVAAISAGHWAMRQLDHFGLKVVPK